MKALREAKVARFPTELQPNPDYRYEPPARVVINGEKCIEVDAGLIVWARDMDRYASRLNRTKANG